MASIVHKRDGRIVVKHKVDGKWVYEYLGRGHAAQELAERKVYDLNLIGAPVHYATPFGELVIRYLGSRIHMAPKNRDTLSYRFNAVILPMLGDVDAVSINHATLNNYIATRKQQSRTITNARTGAERIYPPPSMQTIQAEISTIMVVLNWAAFRCQPPLISENHARGYIKGKINYATVEPPSDEEIKDILSHSSPHLFRAIILDVMCGARPGSSELFRLTWDGVSFADNTITIISADKGGIEKRDIPLSRSLREYLLKWREEDLKTGVRYLIHYRGEPVSSLQTSWRNAKKRAGVTRKLRMYDFRHYFISKMLEGGADLKSVSRMAGHSDERMVLKHYQTITTAMKRAAIDMIPDIALAPAGTTGTTEEKKTAKKINIKQVVSR